MELIIQTQGVKILVVDDNQPNLLIAKGVLERYGIDVVMAQSGREAIEYVKEKDFDLIVLDCIMPEMDGHETAELIRALPGAKGKTPIVAYTANKTEETLIGYEDVGVKDVLEKPLNIVELSKILLRHLAPGKMVDEQEVIRLLNISGDLKDDEMNKEDSALKKALEAVSDLDYEAGMRFVGGDDTSYLNVIKATCKTMNEALERLDAYYRYKTQKGYSEEISRNGADSVRNYGCNGVRIDTHSLKGICAGIGLESFSKDSAVMERMATEENEIALLGDLKPYIMQLQYYYDALSDVVATLLQSGDAEDGFIPMGETAYAELWRDTEESIDMFDIDAIQEGLKRLHTATEAGEKRTALKEAIDASEVFDYSKVAEILARYK